MSKLAKYGIYECPCGKLHSIEYGCPEYPHHILTYELGGHFGEVTVRDFRDPEKIAGTENEPTQEQ